VLVAAGHLAAVAPAVAVLTKGVLRAMFFTKLKVALGVVLVVAALGVSGVAYRPADAQPTQPPKRAEGKPQTELEALRRENELLKLNLEVVLEKVRAQEAELRSLRRAKATEERVRTEDEWSALKAQWFAGMRAREVAAERDRQTTTPAAMREVDAALKALREARDDAARQRVALQVQVWFVLDGDNRDAGRQGVVRDALVEGSAEDLPQAHRGFLLEFGDIDGGADRCAERFKQVFKQCWACGQPVRVFRQGNGTVQLFRLDHDGPGHESLLFHGLLNRCRVRGRVGQFNQPSERRGRGIRAEGALRFQGAEHLLG
jgi:hypothetical protein